MELDRRGAAILFQVLTEREEKASVAIASNESFLDLRRNLILHSRDRPLDHALPRDVLWRVPSTRDRLA